MIDPQTRYLIIFRTETLKKVGVLVVDTIILIGNPRTFPLKFDAIAKFPE